jgi:Gam-like protein
MSRRNTMTDTTLVPADQLLDDWLEGTLDEIGEEPADQEQADRLLWALRGVRRRRAEVHETASARIGLITTWRDQQVDQLDAREADLERLLEGWAQAQHETTSRKTWKLPAGELQVRARRRKTDIDQGMDMADIVAEVRKRIPDAVKVTESVLVSEVADVADVGPVIADYAHAPEGYEAHQAVLHLQDTSPDINGAPRPPRDYVAVVKGVVFLVPVDGREGRTFKAVTK